MGENIRIYYQEANKLFLDTSLEDITQGFQIHFKGANYRFMAPTFTPFNQDASSTLVINKFISNRILAEKGIPVPKAVLFELAFFNKPLFMNRCANLKFPVVAKPNFYTCRGDDVICGIPNIDALYAIVQEMIQKHQAVLVEEFFHYGTDYRILMHKNKILDIVERHPARVIGDGKHTIEQLIHIENKKRTQINPILKKIVIDTESDFLLKKQNITLSDIPLKGKFIKLNHTCNATRGGYVKAYEGRVLPHNIALFQKIMHTFNLDFAGIDIRCVSLMKPFTQNQGVFIEANCRPSIRIHEDGVSGKKQKVAKAVIMRSFIYKHPFLYFFSLFRKKQFIFSVLIPTLFLLSIVVIYIAGQYR